MHKRIIFLFGITLFGAFQVKGQIPNTPINVDLPTASSITKYEQVPVSLSTGTVNVNIPLYVIEENGISLPISLSYDASGMKPNQMSSWVGTNWNLNAGGVITRTINSLPDELYSTANSIIGSPTEYTYLENYSLLNNSNWATLNEYDIDLSPDEFYFSMNGYSGSFFLNHLGEWQVKSNANVKFEVEAQTSGFNLQEKFYSTPNIQTRNITRTFIGFKIKTPDGILYTFGYDPNSIEFTNSQPAKLLYNDNYVSKSWFLTKIEHPNGVVFDLEYERKLEAIFTPSKYFQAYFGTNSASLPGTGNSSSWSGVNYGLSKLFTTYLKSITSPNHTVNFNRADSNEMDYDWSLVSKGSFSLKGWMYANLDIPINHHEEDAYIENSKLTKLISISIAAGTTAIKSFNFVYNNDSDTYDSNNPERLFLKEVRETGANTYLPYKFNYYSGAEHIPYLTFKTDHWGYYNGTSYFDSPATGSLTNQINAFTLSKDSNFDELKKGALSSIDYPTGLSVNFTYEPHKYSKVVEKLQTSSSSYMFAVDDLGINKITGGLRIKAINYFSLPTSKFLIKTFKYESNDTLSSGILGGTPNYFEISGNGSYYLWSVFPVEQMSQTNGSHISYSRVRVKEIEIGEESNGYKEYKFTNHDDPIYRDIPAIAYNGDLYPNSWRYEPFNRQNLVRGKLLEEIIYNDINQEVNKTEYIYNLEYDPPIRSLSVISRQYSNALGTSINLTRYAAFETSRPFLHLSEKKTYSNFEAGINPIVTTTNYLYDLDYKLLTEESFLNSKNQLVKLTTKYPFHFNTNPVLDFMVNKHMVAYPVYRHKEVDSKTISASFNNYVQHTSTNVVLDNIVSLEINRPISDYIEPTLSSNNIVLDDRFKNQIYYKYDIRGNLIEQQRENNFKTYLWGYNYSKPIAIIDNVPYNETEDTLNTVMNSTNSYYLLQNKNETQLTTIFNSLRASMPINSILKTYTYNSKLLLSKFQNERGKTTGYGFDSFNRLTLIIDIDNFELLQYYHYVNYKQ